MLKHCAAFRIALVPAVVLGAVSLFAQTQKPESDAQQAPTIRMTSRLVILDVVVTDKSDRPVNDLKQSDFTIYEDKKPQEIFSFEAPAQHHLPESVEVDSTADLAKVPQAPVTLLVLDELNTSFEDMSYARTAMKNYLNSQPATLVEPTALFVATNSGFQVLRDFTRKRQDLLTALNAHMPQYPWRMAMGVRSGPAALERLAMGLGTLQQIAKAVAGHPGRKNLIWVGRGFPSVDLSGSVDISEQQVATIKGAVQTVMDMLQDARVTVTSIDPTINSVSTADVESPADLLMAENENGSDPFQSEVNFQLLAPATGGRIYLSRNDVDAEIAAAEREGDNYYTISYIPQGNSDAAANYRQILVTVDRPGLVVSTRNGYYAQPSSAAPAPKPKEQSEKALKNELAFDLGSAASSNLQYTGLPTTVSQMSESPSTFVVHVSSQDLHWSNADNGMSQAEVTVLWVSFNAKAKMLSHVAKEMTAQIRTAQLGAAQPKYADFLVTATIPEHATRMRFVVRDANNGKIGTADYLVKR